MLQARARSAGVAPVYGRVVRSLDELAGVDLLVGADGVNRWYAAATREFGATTRLLTNRFAWFGTSKPFETLTQTFIETELDFNAHHYRYESGLGTFIVEVDQASFARAGFAQMNYAQKRALCERIFAQVLDGHALISNNSTWRQFPIVHNDRWRAHNTVLIGDALHTAHFSIGSGTRLAMEDAIALDKALAQHGDDIPAALEAFATSRRPIVEKLVRAANASGDWYEHFAEHMKLAPADLP